ncbi:hypothetical protein [Methanobacterium spitsbergense]|uniref:Uncharacterized protein n=1 Tax=Methanobacterium spitsbergense TaxID=2874285 RepID=A0A8T5UWT1_9EURY|nr:hypothetical protein [Methanobacterium spitsbergense]MBZ2166356.1 hypothetical protein [Methanobacterium spitsbergense]
MNLEEYSNFNEVKSTIEQFPFVDVDIEPVKTKTGKIFFIIGVMGKYSDEDNEKVKDHLFVAFHNLKHKWIEFFKTFSNVRITEIRKVKVKHRSEQAILRGIS